MSIVGSLLVLEPNLWRGFSLAPCGSIPRFSHKNQLLWGQHKADGLIGPGGNKKNIKTTRWNPQAEVAFKDAQHAEALPTARKSPDFVPGACVVVAVFGKDV